ncbi:MAG: ribosome silencing factor [Bacilli bacterium]
MSESKLKLIIKSLDDKKAEQISVIDISNKIPMFDYYVIANGSNPRQLNALASAVEEAVEKLHEHIHHIEGTGDSGWMIVDANDIIVHVFTEETRNHFDFDNLFKDCPKINVESLLK